MSQDIFFRKISTYTGLSPRAEAAWASLLRENTYKRGDNFITEGQTPKKVAFIVSGLMYQYYSADNGDMVVKYFFPENRIAGSMTATLTQSPGNFTIKALEDTEVLEYNFMEFKKLAAI
jgi:CRP-like cAMP-binding protein